MVRIAWVGLLLALSSTALAQGKRAPKPPPPPNDDPAAPPAQDPNQCTKVTGEARWVGMGYTHAIVLRNGCERPVSCTVWTDVDPEPKQTLLAAPGEQVETVTRRGSPARELTASRSCTFR